MISYARKEQDEETATAAPIADNEHIAPAPRISVQAFCETVETAAAVQAAGEDRRLGKAHLKIQMGGMAAAIEAYSNAPTPNVIVLETDGRSDILGGLDELSGVCDAGTRVIVIGRMNDVTLYRELVRRGVSEYLVAPLSVLQIIETIAGLYVNPKAPPIGRVIVFAGSRGGSGASTIAHNVGWHIAEKLKIDTAIIDFDLPFGTAGLNFNEDPGQGVADALAAPERLDDVLLDRLLIKCGEHLSLFAAPALLDRDYEVDASAYETVIDQVRNSVPAVIVDLPHAWSTWARQTLAAADEIVLVATPDLASLRNTKNLLDSLKARRANDAAPKLILNQVGIPKRPEIPAKEFAAAVGQEPVLVLPFEPQLFGTAANNGQMLADVQPTARVSEGVRMLAELITGRTNPQSSKKSKTSFLPFLARKTG